MLTQREKTELLIARIETHDFHEPFKLSREDSRTILKSLYKHHNDLCYGHDNYMANREKKIEKAKERYKANKTEIAEQKRRRIFKAAEKAVRGQNDTI